MGEASLQNLIERALQKAGADGINRIQHAASSDAVRFMIDMIDTSVLPRNLTFVSTTGETLNVVAGQRSVVTCDGLNEPPEITQIAEQLVTFAGSGGVEAHWTDAAMPGDHMAPGIPATELSAHLGLLSTENDLLQRLLRVAGHEVLAYLDPSEGWVLHDDTSHPLVDEAAARSEAAQSALPRGRSVIVLPLGTRAYMALFQTSSGPAVVLLSAKGLSCLSRLWTSY